MQTPDSHSSRIGRFSYIPRAKSDTVSMKLDYSFSGIFGFFAVTHT